MRTVLLALAIFAISFASTPDADARCGRTRSVTRVRANACGVQRVSVRQRGVVAACAPAAVVAEPIPAPKAVK